MITCLARSGMPLSNKVSMLLHVQACDMAKEQKKKSEIKSEYCVGRVTTDFKVAMLGTLCGIQFEAHIETPEGETTVTYIVRNFNREAASRDGGWSPALSWEEMEKILAEEVRAETRY